jgi:hypothetical protein
MQQEMWRLRGSSSYACPMQTITKRNNHCSARQEVVRQSRPTSNDYLGGRNHDALDRIPPAYLPHLSNRRITAKWRSR